MEMYQFTVEVESDPHEWGPHVLRYGTGSDKKQAHREVMQSLTEEFPGCTFNVVRVEDVGAVPRRPGRPRLHTEPRQDVRVSLPVDLIAQIDAATDNRTAYIEQAMREKLQG